MRFLLSVSDGWGLYAHKYLISGITLVHLKSRDDSCIPTGFCLYSREIVIADTLGVSGGKKNITQRAE